MNTDNLQLFFYKNNRQQQLRGFVYTASFGSFSKAAKHMRVGQPTVSMQVKSLEEELEVKLFNRNGPNISLTQDGELLLKIGAPLLKQFDEIFEEFTTRREELKSKTLKIAANHGSIQFLLPPVIKKYLGKTKNRKIELFYAKQHEALDKVRNSEVDLYIGPKNFDTSPEFLITPLSSYKAVALVHHKHVLANKKSISLSELVKFELALLPKELSVIDGLHTLLSNYENFSEQQIKFHNWEMLLEYVVNGIIITIGAEFLANNNKIKAIPIKESLPKADYVIVRLNSKSKSIVVDEFLNILNLNLGSSFKYNN